jgi:two-component system sensor kinase FixL
MKARAPAHRVRETPEAKIQELEARNRELKRMLEIIESARANLADQYDYAPIGSVTLDSKGCIREINLTAARMLGRERPQLLTMPFVPYVAKPHCSVFLHHLRECRSKSQEVTCEVALRKRGGHAISVELRSVPVLDPQHGDIAYRTAITDITDRLRISRALRESEERYRDLVESSPDAIFILTEGVTVFANQAALRLCGVAEAADLIGRELLDWVHPHFRPAVSNLLEARDGREIPMIEAKLVKRDGASVEVEALVNAFRDEDGRAVRVILRDISQRKQAERHVLTISERERSSLGRDLHDSLCQNLTGAAWMIQALRNELQKVSPAAAAQAEEIAGVIRQSIDEARTLARGLCPVTMEKSGLVAALHELTSQTANRTRIRCVLECDDHLMIKDVIVATNVYRIAQEAVANAIRHGKAQSVRIQLMANDGRMTLHVRDDGKGLPAKPKQTGMGLHTMRYRATLIGGSLEVRRVRPRGTVVTCSFPGNGGTP